MVENAADLVTPFSTEDTGVAITYPVPHVGQRQQRRQRVLFGGSLSRRHHMANLNTFEVSEGFVTYDATEGPVQARWAPARHADPNPVVNPPRRPSTSLALPAIRKRCTSVSAGGIWGYAWMIDDLEVFAAPDNDLTVGNYSSYTATATSSFYEYGAWPQSQLPDTLTFAAEVTNVGNNPASGVYASLVVNGEVSVGSPLAGLATGETDTVYVDYATGSDLGIVNLNLTLEMDSIDQKLDQQLDQRTI